jgi:Tfp pilus assembly protein PilN
MKPSSSHAFINQLLVYTIMMICVTGSVGLGTVWLRHQISKTANATKLMEREIAGIERQIAESTARLAAEQSPEMLEFKNEVMELGLVPPQDVQIVRIDESPEERLAAKRNIEIFAEEATNGSVAVRFSLNSPF